MPCKFHASRRHHVPKTRYRVTNRPDHDRGLVRRGDIRFWIEENALEQWDAAKRRFPRRCCWGRRTVDVILDSTGLKFFGAGESRARHGETRRSWRKLHISVDPAGSEIRAHELTGDDTADATMVGPPAAGSGGMIRRVFAGGAYDGEPVTKEIREARPPNSPPEIIVPPRAASIPPPDTPHGGSERELHAAEIASRGRMNRKKRHDCGLRALGETAMARVKRRNGGKLTARTFQSQQNEIAIQIGVLNRSIRAEKPNTIRIR